MKKGNSKSRRCSRGTNKRKFSSPVINVKINISLTSECDKEAIIARENLKWTKIVGIAQLVEFTIDLLFKLIEIL